MFYERELAKSVFRNARRIYNDAPTACRHQIRPRASGAGSPHIPRKPRAGATLDGIPARADKLGLIAEAGYCQNQNVMKTVTAKVQNANAPGLKMAARSSEFGCDTPQKSQRMAPDHTVAEQFLQERFAFRIAEMETNKSSR